MNIFSFLMIMQAIIIGVGISELLTNFARILKSHSLREIGFIVPILTMLLFFALLQMFWETWGLQSHDNWTFPALVLMVSGPILLHMMAHVLFPPSSSNTTLTDYYLKQSSLFWTLGIIAGLVSVLFRPIALGNQLFIIDNLTSFPMIAGFLLLIYCKNIWLHRVLSATFVLALLADTIFINYQIQ